MFDTNDKEQEGVSQDSVMADREKHTTAVPTKVIYKSKPNILACIISGIVGAVVVFSLKSYAGALKPQVVQVPGNSSAQNITINPDDSVSVAQAVAKKTLPSVVSIHITTDRGTGVGSGVVLDDKGDILTNYHVVADAQTCDVTIDGMSYDGVVLGCDPSGDLAVVKVDLQGAKVTPIEIGDSSALQIGDWVMSIGSPFGLDQSVSEGIVSSLYRNTMMPSYDGNTIYTNLIQTDAAINPGNSGGALVNSQGKLVGINSIIESRSGSSSGVGFAIPSNYAIEVANTIISGKKVLHPYIGCQLQTVNAYNAQRAHLGVNQGAYIVSVVPGSPAEEAGLKKGDVIIGIDDQQINAADSLILAVRSHKIGDTIEVTYMDGRDKKTCKLVLGSDESLQQEKDTKTNKLSLEDILK